LNPDRVPAAIAFDLNIHDLGREFRSGSGVGAGIQDVGYWLGQTNVATTSQ
jgi:hypothetical protein